MARVNRLNNDLLGKLRTDPQTYVANLADNIGMLRQKPDLLLFAKPHFAEAMGDFRRRCKLLDSNGSACTNVA